MSQPTEYEQITYNSPDGAQMGKTSTDLISFYGAAPVTRPWTAATLNVSTSTVTTSTTVVGFTSLAEAQNLIAAVSTMQYTMKQLGLIAS